MFLRPALKTGPLEASLSPEILIPRDSPCVQTQTSHAQCTPPPAPGSNTTSPCDGIDGFVPAPPAVAVDANGQMLTLDATGSPIPWTQASFRPSEAPPQDMNSPKQSVWHSLSNEVGETDGLGAMAPTSPLPAGKSAGPECAHASPRQRELSSSPMMMEFCPAESSPLMTPKALPESLESPEPFAASISPSTFLASPPDMVQQRSMEQCPMQNLIPV